MNRFGPVGYTVHHGCGRALPPRTNALDIDVSPANLITEIMGREPHAKALIHTAEADGEEPSNKQDLLNLVITSFLSFR